jgi:hypothetical protein
MLKINEQTQESVSRVLLVTPLRCDKQKLYPLPELVARQTVYGHISKVTPKD